MKAPTLTDAARMALAALWLPIRPIVAPLVAAWLRFLRDTQHPLSPHLPSVLLALARWERPA